VINEHVEKGKKRKENVSINASSCSPSWFIKVALSHGASREFYILPRVQATDGSLPPSYLSSPLPSLRVQAHSDIFPFSAASISLLEKYEYIRICICRINASWIHYVQSCYTYYTITMIRLHKKKSFPNDKSIIAFTRLLSNQIESPR